MKKEQYFTIWFPEGRGFNPCSNGMKKELAGTSLHYEDGCFNPCSNGMKKEQSCNLMIWETVYSLCLSYITCSQPLIGA